ncbi:MAG: ATP synthase F1 subunit delta [Tepidiformaceae bacterium]
MPAEAAKRYAQAAFGIAVDGESLAAWRSDLDDIAQVLSESAAAPVLADTHIPLEQRLAMVDRVLDVQPFALNLARLLVTRGRSHDARAVADAFKRMADAREGIAHASVTSAVQLDAAHVAAIEEKLSASLAKRVHVTAAVDPAIIGGLVIRVGGKLVDGSVRTRLRRLKRELQGAR